MSYEWMNEWTTIQISFNLEQNHRGISIPFPPLLSLSYLSTHYMSLTWPTSSTLCKRQETRVRVEYSSKKSECKPYLHRSAQTFNESVTDNLSWNCSRSVVALYYLPLSFALWNEQAHTQSMTTATWIVRAIARHIILFIIVELSLTNFWMNLFRSVEASRIVLIIIIGLLLPFIIDTSFDHRSRSLKHLVF